jgi:hypothetical protein
MFGELKSVVDLIRSGMAGIIKFKTDKAREEALLGILRTYFLLKDCVDEGETLIADAGTDPIGKISAMAASDARSSLERWDAVIMRQSIRLRVLQDCIFGQHHLTVINPALQVKISEVIGSKMDRANSLHGIGAALFFRTMFPIANTNEERARYVVVMAGGEDDTLDLEKIRAEVSGLRESLDQYRALVERLVPDEELLRLSSRARDESSFRDSK